MLSDVERFLGKYPLPFHRPSPASSQPLASPSHPTPSMHRSMCNEEENGDYREEDEEVKENNPHLMPERDANGNIIVRPYGRVLTLLAMQLLMMSLRAPDTVCGP
ncbi:hypothetical protein MTR_8g106190 [Medicago truncatula]|uniref:Uncharacterized protein n=1 Tax=Medicago truncatula TaxID=3880 RepID=G7LCC8_MEDTR|nr:hypothetical protein MTR_8g106190 [Medicago truncatula]